MKSSFDFRFFLILFLIGLSSFFLYRISVIESQKPIEEVKIDTLVVTKDTTIFKKGSTIFRTRVETLKVPIYIDTSQVIKDYYSKFEYVDTLNFKEHGFVIVTDTVTENSILNRNVNASLNSVYITKEITIIQPPRTEFYIGGGVGFGGSNLFNNATGSIILKTKSKTIYGLDFGLTSNPLNSTIKPYMGIKYYVPLK
jgi:hypothetical protein